MIDFDSTPFIDNIEAPFTMDRELLRSFLLQGTGGASDNDTPLEDTMAMPNNSGNFLQSYNNQQQQIDAQMYWLAKTEQQQQEQQLARQQQQMMQQHQQGMSSLGMDMSNQSTNLNANSSATSGFAPGGLLYSFFSKQDAEEQDRSHTQSQHGTAQFQQGNSFLPQGAAGGTGNTLLPGWMSEQQQPMGGYTNMSNAGLKRPPLSSFTMGGANNSVMGSRGVDQLPQPPMSSYNAGNTVCSSRAATGIPDSLSHARLSAPSLLTNVRSSSGFASAVAQPSSDAFIAANMRNQEWIYSSAASSGTGFGSGVAAHKDAKIDSKRSQFHDQEATTNNFYADNGTIGPWSAASAALLGDLALDSEEKWGKQRKLNKKDKPKRPLSAYNIFFKEERERILEQLPDSAPKEGIAPDDVIGGRKKKKRGAISNDDVSGNTKKKPHGKIDFQSLAKIVGKRWQSLDEGELQLYKAKANADMKRYRDEMKTYNASLSKEKDDEDLNQQQEMQLNQFLF